MKCLYNHIELLQLSHFAPNTNRLHQSYQYHLIPCHHQVQTHHQRNLLYLHPHLTARHHLLLSHCFPIQNNNQLLYTRGLQPYTCTFFVLTFPFLQRESNQEEADTKVFLCAQFAITLGISSIMFVTVDSGLCILAIFYGLYLEMQIVHQLGSSLNIRYLDISATIFSEDLHRALPGFHTFTRCDSTSAFTGKGKHSSV